MQPQSGKKADSTGLIILSCLPVMVIAVVMLAVGGVGLGFLIPAITCGAMIGMLTFVTVREKPRG
jgi:Flp pilus assembly protein TadB